MSTAVAGRGTKTREAVDRFNDAVDRRDVEALRAAITDDCVFESPAPRIVSDAHAERIVRDWLTDAGLDVIDVAAFAMKGGVR